MAIMTMIKPNGFCGNVSAELLYLDRKMALAKIDAWSGAYCISTDGGTTWKRYDWPWDAIKTVYEEGSEKYYAAIASSTVNDTVDWRKVRDEEKEVDA